MLKYWHRAWPNCPHNLEILGCTQMPRGIERYAQVTLLGEDKGWPGNLLAWISDRDEPFILLLEDYIIQSVDVRLMAKACQAIQIDTIGQVRLVPVPGPTKRWREDEDLGEIDKNEAFAISLQAACWKPEVLRDLLISGETPWEVEGRGSQRARNGYDRFTFLGCYGWALTYRMGGLMNRGGILPEVQKWIDEHP
jgi:hypothetical protein